VGITAEQAESVGASTAEPAAASAGKVAGKEASRAVVAVRVMVEEATTEGLVAARR